MQRNLFSFPGFTVTSVTTEPPAKRSKEIVDIEITDQEPHQGTCSYSQRCQAENIIEPQLGEESDDYNLVEPKILQEEMMMIHLSQRKSPLHQRQTWNRPPQPRVSAVPAHVQNHTIHHPMYHLKKIQKIDPFKGHGVVIIRGSHIVLNEIKCSAFLVVQLYLKKD